MRKTEGNIRSSYKFYRNNFMNVINDLKKYIEINNAYMQFLVAKVLEGHEVTLPERLGTLEIRGKKDPNKVDENGKPVLPIDYAKTKELWKNCPECKARKQKMYHLNLHTDGVSYKYFWSKKNSLTENKEFYSLRMTRDNKRQVPLLVNEGKRYAVKRY